ncbi:hypothetical protein N9N48_07225, partial [Luminiphilus sp.]|nr:hypothetical protein [Luminiphilus sp.]
WWAWIESGGSYRAFPYGVAMWVIFVPATLAAELIGVSTVYAYSFTLLIADLIFLLVLTRFVPNRPRLVLLAYWLSAPLVLATYGLGLNDLIPALLLFLSLLFVRQYQFYFSGIFMAGAISAKLSMIVALPFFLIYLYNNQSLRRYLPKFLASLAVGCFVLVAPFIFSAAGMQMLLSNPEMQNIYQLHIGLAGGVSIFVIPLVYLTVLYVVWRVRRLNFDLFQATTGMAFLLIVLSTPTTPGWFVWCIPFLVIYQALSGRVAIFLVGVFYGIYALSTLIITDIHLANGNSFELDAFLQIPGVLRDSAASLLHTSMVAVGIILAIRMWREAITSNDFFRLSRKPFVLGIAGDSGAGKDTFVDAITGLFGQHSVAKLSGDDYHLWDRKKPMWQVMTHLNPMANDLEGFCSDLISLTDGKGISSRHYDHASGKMSKPRRLKSNDFIIASGLHALYLPALRERYDLNVYLDIDEGLRRHFKLQRDVHQRGHDVEQVLASFERREPDSERFVRPQSKYADLRLSLQPIHPKMLEEADGQHAVRLKLVVNTSSGLSEVSLHRVLVGVCGQHLDISVSDDGSQVKMTIEGESSAEDIKMAAQILCPRILEFLDVRPQWEDGLLGMMQLITLSHINQQLTKRFT